MEQCMHSSAAFVSHQGWLCQAQTPRGCWKAASGSGVAKCCSASSNLRLLTERGWQVFATPKSPKEGLLLFLLAFRTYLFSSVVFPVWEEGDRHRWRWVGVVLVWIDSTIEVHPKSLVLSDTTSLSTDLLLA